MKRFLTLLGIGVILISLTGCGKKEEPIALNKDNFEDYIILEVKQPDFEKEQQRGLISTYEYRGTAQLVATARLKKDVKTENVIIKEKIVTSRMAWAGNVYEFTLELDKDGKAEYSQKINSGKFTLVSPDEPSYFGNLDTFKVYTEVKDDDFVYKDVLLNVSGTIYE